jgi:hypothetical protein
MLDKMSKREQKNNLLVPGLIAIDDPSKKYKGTLIYKVNKENKERFIQTMRYLGYNLK